MLSSSVRSANPSMIVYSKGRLCRFQNEIPAGARIVVRTCEGVDPKDQRMKSAIMSVTYVLGTGRHWK